MKSIPRHQTWTKYVLGGGLLAAAASCQGSDGASPTPVVSAAMPALGPTTGGTAVTIQGDHFVAGDLKVTFAGIAAPSVTWMSATELVAVLPADPGKIGQVAVAVTNPDGMQGQSPVFAYYLGALSFARSPSFATAMGPTAPATADVNGDGNLDVVVAALRDNQISVLLGNGDGTFQPSKNFAGGMSPFGVRIAELNADNKPDLVWLTHLPVDSVMVALGNGDGTFTSLPANTDSSLGLPNDFAPADFNGDGKADVVVTNGKTGPGFVVLLGKGDGTFQAGLAGPLDSSVQGVAAADVKNKHKLWPQGRTPVRRNLAAAS